MTLISIIILLAVNNIIIKPMDNKISDLKIQKEQIKLSKDKSNQDKYINQESNTDIVLKIERELNSILDIKNINKSVSLDENDKKQYRIELKVISTIDNLLNIDNKLKLLSIDKSIESIKINNIQNDIEDSEKNNVDCIMTFNVK